MLVIFQNMWVTGQNNTLWATYPLSLWIKYEYLIYIEWSNKRISKRIIPRQETRIPYAGNRAWRLFGNGRYHLLLWDSGEASLMPQPLFCRLLKQTAKERRMGHKKRGSIVYYQVLGIGKRPHNNNRTIARAPWAAAHYGIVVKVNRFSELTRGNARNFPKYVGYRTKQYSLGLV